MSTNSYQLQTYERFTNIESLNWSQYVLQFDYVRTKKKVLSTPLFISFTAIGILAGTNQDFLPR